MNEIKEPEKEIKEENNLPPGFTPVIEEDQKKEECIFEVTKSKNYEKIFPSLIQKIDQKLYQNKSSEDYPYFNKNNKIKFLPRLDSKSEILSNNQLKELPVSKLVDITKIKEENKRCTICLEDFKNNDEIIYLPCFHFFHKECIRIWLENSKFCPFCRLAINQNNVNG